MLFRKILIATAFLMICSTHANAETLTGVLTNLNDQFAVQTQQALIPVQFAESQKEAVASLIGKARFVQVEVSRSHNGALVADRIPTIVSGDRTLSGLLTSTMTAEGRVEYEVNGLPIAFGDTKQVNGAMFDEQSMEYYVGKKINARATIQNGVYVVQSIMRADVLSAQPAAVIDEGLAQKIEEGFFKNPSDYLKKLLKSRKSTGSSDWMKTTLFENKSTEVQPNDYALVISASGRQGDSMGAVNGHFAVGIVKVGQDMQLKGEMFNFYVINEKQIIPGDVELTDYFGHLISGQSNYRPTFTMMLYGMDSDRLMKVRDQLDRFHSIFRTTSRKITCDINCASMSVQALADVDIFGSQRNKNPAAFPRLSEMKELPPKISFLKTVLFLFKTKRAEFMPGPALMSFLENIPQLNEKFSMKRVDIIVGGQTPSSRLRGGSPTDGIFNELTEQGIVGANVYGQKFLRKLGRNSGSIASSSGSVCKDLFVR
jgi:hypothetical protein